MLLLQIPSFQGFVAKQVSHALEQKLGTKVDIGRINLGFLNRIIIDNVLVYDQTKKQMLQASRLAAKIDVLPLLSEGRIYVSSAQLFGVKANLYRKSALEKDNFQFILDSLSSKEKSKTPLDLRIQSLIIRNGAVSYHQLDTQQTKSVFNPKHLNVSGISAHIMLPRITEDTLSLSVKKLSFQESSGLDVKDMFFNLNVGKQYATLNHFLLRLPNSQIRIDELSAHYHLNEKQRLDRSSFSYNLVLDESSVTPSDFACFLPNLKNSKNSLSMIADARGNYTTLYLDKVRINASTGSFGVKGSGMVSDFSSSPHWKFLLEDLKITPKGMQVIANNIKEKSIKIPDEIVRMGNIRFKGSAEGKRSFYAIKGKLRTDVGDAHMDFSLNGNAFHGILQTGDIQIGHILNDYRLGNVKADIHAEGTIGKGQSNLPFNTLIAKGNIQKLDYNGYQYGTINIDGKYDGEKLDGLFLLNDPNGKIALNGQVILSGKVPMINAKVKASQLNMRALHLTDELGNRTFDFEAKADFSGSSLEQANGILDVRNFTMTEHGKAPIRIENLYLETGYHDQEHFINVQGDFGNMLLRGQYNYGTLPQSFTNLIASKLPTLPGLPRAIKQSANDFAMIANISDATLLRSITGIPITLHQPLHLKSVVNDHIHEMEIDFDLPDFSYDDSRFKNAHANLTTRNDTLCSHAYINRMYDDGRKLSLELEAKAADNRLGTTLVWDTHGSRLLHGVLNAETEFFRTEEGQNAAHMRIHPSELYVDGNKWEVQPSDIIYSHKHLNIDQFQVSKGSQHLIVSGLATSSPKDSVNIDLQDIDVAYVLDLVDFHSVDFSGIASGRATLRNIFGTPEAYAQLKVQDFRFENGRMGTLHAHADYDVEEGQINIDAIADDLPSGQTLISGYVSPRKNYIDLGIMAHHSPLEFIRSFCSSFMGDVSVRGDGTCRVFGDLRKINLEGLMTATGTIEVTPLNTVYSLRKDTIRMIPDEIIFPSDTIYDRENHFAVVTGALHHKNLTNLTFDMSIDAQNFLSYDTHDYGDQTFFGTVYGTGTCDIKGRSGEISFDINATPDEGSFIEYNAAGPESISSAEFIHWESAHKQAAPYSSYDSMQDATVSQQAAMKNQTSDLRLNFLINTTPDFTLRVLMDETTGDRIDLNGEGMLRANYFNKGAFDLFGNYQVEHGTYTMTIQNVIKKAFTFQSGSSIIFGGDPFQAQLNLKGIYSLPAVSLSDLQMGRSFTQNNIRVNCLMDIGGTAGQPNVTFGLDLPTLSADARQMVQSVINSEEDMNQQVLYLLAVGRFLPQTGNNAIEDGTQQSQTSLAMQSILSGTISQQINTVLSNVVKSNNWNFGANISTGDEGFSNAEYEGLLSGRLLNNRLLINGEFGYRDNVTTDKGTSFIGDFDVQYLLYPNGNLAVKVYNQTNDRYFTRNSLTTQGIGIIMKKDFNTFRDLFRKKKKAKNGERNILNATTNKNEKSEK